MLGRTPLLIAVSLDMPSPETVATLIALGADWNIPDAMGATPMSVAVDRGRPQLAWRPLLAVARGGGGGGGGGHLLSRAL